MIIEFQLSAAVLGRIVRNQFHNSHLCVSEPFPVSDPRIPDIEIMVMIDHITVGEATTLAREPGSFIVNAGNSTLMVPGFKAVVSQPLEIHVAPVAGLEASGPRPFATMISGKVRVLIDVTAVAENGQAKLQLAFNDIDFGVLRDRISSERRAQILSQIRSLIPPVKRLIDLSELEAVAPGINLRATNAGATATSNGEALIVRVEMDENPSAAASWTEFVNTYDRNLLGTNQWAMLVDKDLLSRSMSSRLSTLLAGAADKFRLRDGISISWNPGSGSPAFDISFRGEVIDACICAFPLLPVPFPVDLDVDVSTRMTFQVPAEGVLRAHTHVTHDTNDLETFCCVLTAGLFWPVVGQIYLAQGKVSFGQYVLGVSTTPIGPLIAAFAAAGSVSTADLPGQQGDCKKVDDRTVECDERVTFHLPGLGAFHLSSVSAQPDGPVLAGPVEMSRELKNPVLSITDLKEFSWGVGGSCGQGMRAELSAEATCKNDVRGSILKLCDVSVLDDPIQVFTDVQVENVEIRDLPSIITVRPDRIKLREYLAAPYPCKLRINSNGGTRILTFAPGRAMTPQEVEELDRAVLVANMSCWVVVPDPFVATIGKILWRPDPPFDVDIAQHWQVVVSDLTARDSIDLVGLGGRVLASATPNDHGVAVLSHWSEGAARLEEIGLRVNVPDASGREIQRHVAVKQVQLELRSRLALRGEHAELELSRSDGRTVLTVHTSAEHAAYDVTVPRMPLPVAVPEATRFTARRLGAQRDVRISHHEHEIRVADRKGNLLLLLEGIVHQAVAAARDFLFVARDEDVEAYDVRGGVSEKILLARLAEGGVTRIERVKVPGVERALALVGRDGETRVVDASDVTSVRVIGRYRERPWFLDSARSRKVFARISADGKHVSVYEITQVEEIGPGVESGELPDRR
jgi:hypothetical protein